MCVSCVWASGVRVSCVCVVMLYVSKLYVCKLCVCVGGVRVSFVCVCCM